MRVVLDANVLLAAYGTGGACYELLQICLARHELYLSEYILDEVSRHLQRKFGAAADHAAGITTRLGQMCSLVNPSYVKDDACDDPEDLPVLGTALAARAHCLITGDKALLRLRLFRDTLVLSPRQFLDAMA